MQSGSDTADLLIARALQGARERQTGRWRCKLLDSVVDLYPDWSEAWSERATARFQSGDVAGAMADVAQTLKREPRDLGALAGLAAMMLDAGDADAARCRVYDRALELAPGLRAAEGGARPGADELWSRSP